MASGHPDTVPNSAETHDAGDSTVELSGPGSLICTDCGFPELSAPAWLAEARVDAGDEPHLAWFDTDGEGPRVIRLTEGWTRIGRGEAADIRLDDPSVSRRHALVVRTETGELRALDDRSLNGLFVNGEKVEWTKLEDGDELEIGSFRLYVIDPD